jgi:O-antigen/teichoic acid export membrane protein
MWFLLFNLGTILYLIMSGHLQWNSISIFSYGLALVLMNGIAWISARKYKDWK